MCELFGLSSSFEYETGPVLREFFSHAVQNPHGWGLVNMSGSRPFVQKEAVSALKSETLRALLDSGVRTDLLIGHIRFATKGSISLTNTHPFRQASSDGTTWTLAHNGTVFSCDELTGYVHKQEGETDSERILDLLLDRIDRALLDKIDAARDATENASCKECADEILTVEERIRTIDELIHIVTPGNKINILISDGTLLYAHSNMKGSMYYHMEQGLAAVSSKPLESMEGWTEMPLNTLLAFRDGECVYRGAPHENEYIEDPEKLKFLFLDYAGM